MQTEHTNASQSHRFLRSGNGNDERISNPKTGVLIERCIFCKKKRKQFKNKSDSLIKCTTESIQVFNGFMFFLAYFSNLCCFYY